jgi:hypothetical protein
MPKFLSGIAALALVGAAMMPIQASATEREAGASPASTAQSTEFSGQRRYWRHGRYYGHRYYPRRYGYWGPRYRYWGPRYRYWGPRYGYWGPRYRYWGPRPIHYGYPYPYYGYPYRYYRPGFAVSFGPFAFAF